MTFNKEKYSEALNEFYAKVREDNILGPVFNENVTNWDSHLRKIEIFWENHLVMPGLYKGNPHLIHQKLHEKFPLTEEMFQRWLELFEVTMKDFLGDEAKKMIMKARIIGGTLYGRILEKDLEVPGFPPFGKI